MAKRDKDAQASSEKEENKITFGIVSRPVIAVPYREIDQTIETVQGQERSVKQLYEDYVLGKLDPRQLGGGDYDDDASDDVDPFNKSGLTFEEATEIADAGRAAANEMKRSRSVADHPRESSEQRDKENPREPSQPEHP